MDLDQAFVINGDDLRIALGRADLPPEQREAAEFVIREIAQPVGKAGIRVTPDQLAVALAYSHNAHGGLERHHGKLGSDRLAADLLAHVAEHRQPNRDPWAPGDDVVDAHVHCEHAPESSAASELEIADQVVRLLEPLGYAGSRRLKPHECTFCLGHIQPGERYVSSVLPPGGELGNAFWWRLASHGSTYADCPKRERPA